MTSPSHFNYSHKHWLFGYGSLLSFDSRSRFSGIHAPLKAASIKGWQRGWMIRYTDEQQTYVGAVKDASSWMNGAFLPIETIDQGLQQRERGYCFTQIQPEAILLNDTSESLPSDKTFWICESLTHQTADKDHPVCQSYVDTCLAGCFENGGEGFALDFINSTLHWDQGWVDDRASPNYPRSAKLDNDTIELIDHLLLQANVLHHREPGPI